MDKINILYIDDDFDFRISKYMAKYKNKNVDIAYDELLFDDSLGYEKLINDIRVYSANIILIDSQLFKNETAFKGKYTGEQFRLILRKLFPFIKVIVITQNPLNQAFPSTISKYKPEMKETPDDYYKNNLENLLDLAIDKVCEYRKIKESITQEIMNKYFIEKIENSLDGLSEYDELSKSDIDKIVEAFKRIQETLNE